MRLPKTLLTYGDIREEIERLYGKDADIFAGKHHARRILRDVPIHVISRIFQGRFLLNPNKRLARIIKGVIARAQLNYTGVELNTYAFMSNHMHMQIIGPPDEVVDFIAFVKREISRRWGRDPSINWSGTMWHGYLCTALPTEASQLQCFRYICSHGVKERIVNHAREWEGAHAAEVLLADEQVTGQWFNGTEYSRATDAQKRRKEPKTIHRKDYWRTYPLVLAPILPLAHLTPEDYRSTLTKMFDEIAEDGRIARGGKPVSGMAAAQRIPLNHRSQLPPQPWLERGRSVICWADPRDPEAQTFTTGYWEFQRAYREASQVYRGGKADVEFPGGSFRPGRFDAAPRESELAAA